MKFANEFAFGPMKRCAVLARFARRAPCSGKLPEKPERREAIMSDTFIILRKEHDSYCSLGPLARSWSLDEARTEIASLAARFPQQEFRLFADVGGAVCRGVVSLDLPSAKIEQPQVAGITPIRNQARAA
jgi:hypothetical protein